MNKEELLSRLDILRSEYVSLLNDKDVLLNWGKPQLEALYATRIGVHQIEELQQKLRIKALKRKIELVRSAIAHNAVPDVIGIELQVAEELAFAERQIMEKALLIEKGKELLANLDTPLRSAELRKVFRQLARQLHPDVNPNLTDEQQRLWHLVMEAYENGDVERLKALQVAYEKELNAAEMQLSDLTEDELTMRITILAEGIKVLHEQVAAIRKEFPFTIEQQIKDDEWVESEVAKINESLARLGILEEELLLEYNELINGHG